MKKSTKYILFTVGLSTAAIYSYNKYIETTATKKNLLTKEYGEYYTWKYGKLFYTKIGTGSPLLLIHDIDASSSSAEWNKIVHHLSQTHTVYSLDLLGCGKSDKPAIEYTNYLYVQMITSFIKDIIKDNTSVVSTNLSTSFIIMANHMDKTLFDKLIFINPVSLEQLKIVPDLLSKFKMRLIEVPFIGTFIYNLMTNYSCIDNNFRTHYYEKPQFITNKIEDIYYEAAHTNGNNGRYLHSSKLGNYLNNNITHAVKSITVPSLIIESKNIENYSFILDSYHNLNSNIKIKKLVNGSLYPHMEYPEDIISIIENFLNDLSQI